MLELTVEGMSCAHCVAAVTRTVQQIDQDATVEIDLASKKVRIDSSAAPATLTDAINEAGYTVV